MRIVPRQGESAEAGETHDMQVRGFVVGVGGGEYGRLWEYRRVGCAGC